MGKASSSKKVQRAARAAASSRGASERRELGFPLVVAAVMVLGIALVVFSRESRDTKSAAPTLSDHWHSAYGVYDCDTFLPPFPEQPGGLIGIHSHGDGLIHVHPGSNAATGERAQVDLFLDNVGVEVSEEGITAPGVDLPSGSDCNGEPTVIRVARFDIVDGEAVFVEEIEGGFDEIVFLHDLEAFTIARIPADAEIPPPPPERVAGAVRTAGEDLSPLEPVELDPSGLFDDADETDPSDGTGSVDDSDGTDETEPAGDTESGDG